MNILKKKINLSSFSTSKQIEVEKAYTEGVYCDSPANRKLGRVGMTYAAYAAKSRGGKKENTESKKEKISLTKDNFKNFLNNNEIKIKGELKRKDGSHAIVGKVTKINYDDSSQNPKPYEVSIKWYGNGETEKKSFENISYLNRWINQDKVEVTPKENKKENITDIDKILAKSDDLGRAKGKRLDAIISYAEFDNVPKDATDEEKRKIIAENYIKSAELSGTPEEIANDLDEIIEDAIADYVPPKKKDDIEEKKKLSWIEARTVLNYSDTLANATTRQLNNVIDYSGFDIDKNLSDDEKREKLTQKYYASADLYELTSAKEVANALDGIIEDALEDYVSSKK